MPDNNRRSSRLQHISVNDPNSNPNSSSYNSSMTRRSSAQGTNNYAPVISSDERTIDAASQLASFATMNVEYDPTEGAGGLSVSSYDSIDSDRSGLNRTYSYNGKFYYFSVT